MKPNKSIVYLPVMNKILNKEISPELIDILNEKNINITDDNLCICRCCDKPITINDFKNGRYMIIKHGGHIHWNCGIAEIYTPTISDVLDYIYEKYDIHISICPHVESQHRLIMRKFSVSIYKFEINLNVQEEILRNDDIVYFNSPTEAYESAIKYVLTNYQL